VSEFLHTAIDLITAFVLGGLIGVERQWRQRSAGLRTSVLVALGAAAFVDLGGRVAAGSPQVIAYVVSGIGFLGAGAIMKEGPNIRGLNTAATLWCSAAVGAFAGSGRPLEAVLVAVLVLAGNTLLRPLVDFINRAPVSAQHTEAVYRVHVTCDPEKVSAARDVLYEELEGLHYPIREIETLSDNEDVDELAAVLVPTTANPADLDAIAEHLGRHPEIDSATWTVSAEL
jgi:putative Mg2+ transporter-C (MgtC) family protein